MVNQEIITRLFSLLNQYLSELKAEQQITWDDFSKGVKFKRYIERTLQMAIEVCFDAGNHIISDEGWPEAKTNREIFVRLSEKRVISASLLEDLLQMSSFRNRVVHDYADINPEVVFGILRNHLKDFESYISEILKWIESQN
ncbi:MAG: hypothetical protein A3D13_06110 [Planctomycetes bacterium RIFCSPHIGHO2_02_FULL_40_12]|jgi:uncharacterized protein YutE (UPF0331/DUF86 family)|nr:MAG: hypothetical protein A3D13_06110 [Planctomycetes bacterium RIFCSPHIGHO2_02_FULL_40_12]OHC01857.1 MAG: hypothetical protein A3H23_04675 [Planctomycetes bacterium RIFCSPLOWO2_12_FULL_40_19]